ncbi:zinc finger protein 367-like [Amblyomma americanum]|uniref:C2H2-type domain-containing protein n=1 Tax=Amblyomma americanum TaxID=6943 RepID=A0AAQ4FC22_AMBAM
MSCAPFATIISSPSPCSPPIRDQAFYPWNWHEVAEAVDLKSPRAGSAAAAGGRPASPDTPTTPHSGDGQRRGRPRLDAITSLIREGSSSPSSIKCKVCNRVFPREKSLQAHMRTHTGEKPYTCDFPGCSRAFAQSGQLKTHQRLHTGEKPFVCSEPGCNQRYTHSNRRCSRHPFTALRRDETTTAVTGKVGEEADSENQSEAVALWLKNHLKQQQQSPSEVSSGAPKARQLKRELDAQAQIDSEELLQKKKKPPASSTQRDIIGALALIELHQSERAPSAPRRVEAVPACAVYPIDNNDRPLDLTTSRYCTYDL